MRACRFCPGGRGRPRRNLGPGGSPWPGGPGGRPAGVRQMRWQHRDLHRGGGQGLRQGRLRGGVDEHRVHPAQQGPHHGLVGAAALMRQHVVAQRDHRAAPGPGRSRQGQVGRRLNGRDDGQHHHVAALAGQPGGRSATSCPAGTRPAAAACPGTAPPRARRRSAGRGRGTRGTAPARTPERRHGRRPTVGGREWWCAGPPRPYTDGRGPRSRSSQRQVPPGTGPSG